MKAIVAVDRNWGIGTDNQLLFSIPQDMKFFRQTTLNKVVVMGANTLKSFPNGLPLKNRINVVLSTTLNRDDCIVVDSVDKLLTKLKEFDSDEIFVIGGAKVYATLLDYCSEVLVTKVDSQTEADVFFPNLDQMKNWHLFSEGQEILDNGYTIKFTAYSNSEVKSF